MIFHSTEYSICRMFSYQIGLASCRRLIAFDVMTIYKDSVYRNHVARLEIHHIPNDKVEDRYFLHYSGANNLHISILLLSIELYKLAFLLPIIQCTNKYNDGYGRYNSDAFHPFHAGLVIFVRDSD